MTGRISRCKLTAKYLNDIHHLFLVEKSQVVQITLYNSGKEFQPDPSITSPWIYHFLRVFFDQRFYFKILLPSLFPGKKKNWLHVVEKWCQRSQA